MTSDPVRQLDPVLRAWALEQMAPWIMEPVSKAELEAAAMDLNRTSDGVFVFDITGQHVSVRDKPDHYDAARMRDSSIPHIFRMMAYRKFLSEVLSQRPLGRNLTMAIDLSDGAIRDCEAPIFGFQKPRDSRLILLPDPEFLQWDYYEDAQFRDDIAFKDKLDKAVFVGSTTGGRIIGPEDVRTLAVPRLRAGMFFRDAADVDFRLPSIVQVASSVVEAAIRALGFGGGRATWQDQLRYKLLISMDGNGAACSRLALGLKSNSIVLKYASESQLYYFSGLKPWLHYIPVDGDEQVLKILDDVKYRPVQYEHISTESAEFYSRFLGRQGVLEYTAELLRLYVDRYD